MKRVFAIAVLGFPLVTFGMETPAQATEISDVVGARANARAGGPLTDHDAWLLERYGALSGTPGYSPGGTRYRGYKKKKKYAPRRRYRYDW